MELNKNEKDLLTGLLTTYLIEIERATEQGSKGGMIKMVVVDNDGYDIQVFNSAEEWEEAKEEVKNLLVKVGA